MYEKIIYVEEFLNKKILRKDSVNNLDLRYYQAGDSKNKLYNIYS